jgi:Na+/melibiose symporter-like transporter
VLLVLQFATIISAAGTSIATRRWAAAPLMAVAAAFWCSGALLWLFAMPFPAVVLLGIGLGSGTVLSWAEVARTIAELSLDVSSRVEARAYAALTALRDLVSAIVPSTIGIALSGVLLGLQVPPARLLIAVALGAAVVIALNLRHGSARGPS